MRTQKLQRLAPAKLWALGEAFYRVACWMLLLLVVAFMLQSTRMSVQANWTRGAYHPSRVTHTMPEEDFANLWTAGGMVRAGQLDALYSEQRFQAWKQARFGTDLRAQDWIYPPTVLLIGVPLSLLPLVPAYALWDIGTLVLAMLLLRHARLPWPILLIGLLGPATWRSLELGQYGVITGACVAAGLLLAPRRPLQAGILLGLSTLKPQQGVIVPVAWLAARNGRAIAAAAATFGVLAAIIACWLGPHAWVLFFTQSGAMARGILDLPPPQPNINTGLSVFWMLRTFGSGIAFANIAHGVVALIAVILTYRAWRLPDVAPLPRMGATACLSLFISPYGYTCDMVAFSIAVAVVFAANGWRLGLLDILLWTWPFFCTVVTIRGGLLLTPLIVTIAAARCWRRMKQPAPVYATAVSASVSLSGEARYST